MNIEDIYSEWSIDANIDINHLDRESLQIPKLHGKYLKFLSNERLLLIKYQADFKKLKLLKFEYYSGSLDEETLKERNWKPWGKLILKGELDYYIDSDKDIIDLSLKIGYQKEKVSVLESILNSLSSRGFQIKSALDHIRMQNGGY